MIPGPPAFVIALTRTLDVVTSLGDREDEALRTRGHWVAIERSSDGDHEGIAPRREVNGPRTRGHRPEDAIRRRRNRGLAGAARKYASRLADVDFERIFLRTTPIPRLVG